MSDEAIKTQAYQCLEERDWDGYFSLLSEIVESYQYNSLVSDGIEVAEKSEDLNILIRFAKLQPKGGRYEEQRRFEQLCSIFSHFDCLEVLIGVVLLREDKNKDESWLTLISNFLQKGNIRAAQTLHSNLIDDKTQQRSARKIHDYLDKKKEFAEWIRWLVSSLEIKPYSQYWRDSIYQAMLEQPHFEQACKVVMAALDVENSRDFLRYVYFQHLNKNDFSTCLLLEKLFLERLQHEKALRKLLSSNDDEIDLSALGQFEFYAIRSYIVPAVQNIFKKYAMCESSNEFWTRLSNSLSTLPRLKEEVLEAIFHQAIKIKDVNLAINVIEALANTSHYYELFEQLMSIQLTPEEYNRLIVLCEKGLIFSVVFNERPCAVFISIAEKFPAQLWSEACTKVENDQINTCLAYKNGQIHQKHRDYRHLDTIIRFLIRQDCYRDAVNLLKKIPKSHYRSALNGQIQARIRDRLYIVGRQQLSDLVQVCSELKKIGYDGDLHLQIFVDALELGVLDVAHQAASLADKKTKNRLERLIDAVSGARYRDIVKQIVACLGIPHLHLTNYYEVIIGRWTVACQDPYPVYTFLLQQSNKSNFHFSVPIDLENRVIDSYNGKVSKLKTVASLLSEYHLRDFVKKVISKLFLLGHAQHVLLFLEEVYALKARDGLYFCFPDDVQEELKVAIEQRGFRGLQPVDFAVVQDETIRGSILYAYNRAIQILIDDPNQFSGILDFIKSLKNPKDKQDILYDVVESLIINRCLYEATQCVVLLEGKQHCQLLELIQLIERGDYIGASLQYRNIDGCYRIQGYLMQCTSRYFTSQRYFTWIHKILECANINDTATAHWRDINLVSVISSAWMQAVITEQAEAYTAAELLLLYERYAAINGGRLLSCMNTLVFHVAQSRVQHSDFNQAENLINSWQAVIAQSDQTFSRPIHELSIVCDAMMNVGAYENADRVLQKAIKEGHCVGYLAECVDALCSVYLSSQCFTEFLSLLANFLPTQEQSRYSYSVLRWCEKLLGMNRAVQAYHFYSEFKNIGSAYLSSMIDLFLKPNTIHYVPEMLKNPDISPALRYRLTGEMQSAYWTTLERMTTPEDAGFLRELHKDIKRFLKLTAMGNVTEQAAARKLQNEIIVHTRAQLDKLFLKIYRSKYGRPPQYRGRKTVNIYFPVVPEVLAGETVSGKLNEYYAKIKTKQFPRDFVELDQYLLHIQPLSNQHYLWLRQLYLMCNTEKHDQTLLLNPTVEGKKIQMHNYFPMLMDGITEIVMKLRNQRMPLSDVQLFRPSYFFSYTSPSTQPTLGVLSVKEKQRRPDAAGPAIQAASHTPSALTSCAN